MGGIDGVNYGDAQEMLQKTLVVRVVITSLARRSTYRILIYRDWLGRCRVGMHTYCTCVADISLQYGNYSY